MKNPWRMLGLAWLVYCYFGAMAVSFAPILPTIEHALHTTSTGGGMLLGAYPLMYVISAIAIGQVCDRLGVKLSTALGVTVIALSMLLRSVSRSFDLMLFAATLLGLGGPVVSTVLPKLVAERFEGPTRTVASGVYATGPAVGAALVLGMTSGALTIAGSWRTLYFCYFLIGLVVVGVWMYLARDVARSPDEVGSHDERRAREGLMVSPSDGSTELASAGYERPSRAHSRRVWQMPSVWMVVLVGVAVFTIGQGFSSWLPTILQSKGVTPSKAGEWASLSRISQVPGSVGVCYLVARMQVRNARKRAVMVLLAVSASTVAAVAFHLGPAIYPVLVVQGAAAGAMLPLLMSIVMDLPSVRTTQMAMAAALYFTVGQIAGAGAPILIGWMRDATGSFTAGILFVAGASLAALVPATRIVDTGRGLAGSIERPEQLSESTAPPLRILPE